MSQVPMNAVNHTTVAGGVKCATCEWCEDVATYRVKVSPTYQRFACEDPKHRARTDRLVAIDQDKDRKREVTYNPTGFNVRGRLLGTKGLA